MRKETFLHREEDRVDIKTSDSHCQCHSLYPLNYMPVLISGPPC